MRSILRVAIETKAEVTLTFVCSQRATRRSRTVMKPQFISVSQSTLETAEQWHLTCAHVAPFDTHPSRYRTEPLKDGGEQF
jgi:hypothetical protein